MTEENLQVVCESPLLNATVENVIQMLKHQEDEVQKLDQRKWSLEGDIEHLKKVGQFLEREKAEIEDDIAKLRIKNQAYQKEHTNLRNSITVAKFQIEKIKESIAVAKANDLKALEEFEKAVDEITEKFRAGPETHDRQILMEKIKTEKEKRDVLIQKLREVTESYDNFNKANGLRERKDTSEELLACVLPGSLLSSFIEMTRTLDEVVTGIKNFTGKPEEK